eukprot:9201149-Alexandrium_andersonii.AAC.1
MEPVITRYAAPVDPYSILVHPLRNRDSNLVPLLFNRQSGLAPPLFDHVTAPIQAQLDPMAWPACSP